MTASLVCNHCRQGDKVRQVKAGCGHLVNICHDCESEVNAIRHEECRGCKVVASQAPGGFNRRTFNTPEEVLEAEASMYDDYKFAPSPFDDDYLFEMDDPAYPFSCDRADALDAEDDFDPADYYMMEDF